MATGQNQHLCALCSPGFTSSSIRRFGPWWPRRRADEANAASAAAL